jgi:uncharacterized protein
MRTCEALVNVVADWAIRRDDIRAMALVGSWARGNPHPHSDLDLLLLTDEAEQYCDDHWVAEIGFGREGYSVCSSRSAIYGAAASRHVQLVPAADVELTFATCSWAGAEPIDEGTRAIVNDAFRVIFDKDGVMARLVDALRTRT